MAKEKPQPEVPQAPVEIPLPRVEVLDRALQSPFGVSAPEIKLKNPGLICRWCNTELGNGAQLFKTSEAGYLKVKPEYLADPETFQFNVSPDGYVVRGVRGQEILMYTTVEHAKQRAAIKVSENLRRMRQTKTEMVEAAGKQLGDQAADYLNRTGRAVGHIEDSYERLRVDEN